MSLHQGDVEGLVVQKARPCFPAELVEWHPCDSMKILFRHIRVLDSLLEVVLHVRHADHGDPLHLLQLHLLVVRQAFLCLFLLLLELVNLEQAFEQGF